MGDGAQARTAPIWWSADSRLQPGPFIPRGKGPRLGHQLPGQQVTVPTLQPSFAQRPGPRALWKPGLRGHLWDEGCNQPLPPTGTHEPRVVFPGQRPGLCPPAEPLACSLVGPRSLAGLPCESRPVPGARGCQGPALPWDKRGRRDPEQRSPRTGRPPSTRYAAEGPGSPAFVGATGHGGLRSLRSQDLEPGRPVCGHFPDSSVPGGGPWGLPACGESPLETKGTTC